MPGFDGTGPRGAGAMTGGSRGNCVVPIGGVNRGFGRGMGMLRRRLDGMRRGAGGRRGSGFCGNWEGQSSSAHARSPMDAHAGLQEQLHQLQDQLAQVQGLLGRLDASSTSQT